MSKISEIINLVRSGGKNAQDLGDAVGTATYAGTNAVNSRTLAKNLGKYSLLPAAAGLGVGAGAGGGVWLASEGVKAAGENVKDTFSLDFSSIENLSASASKLSGWIIAAAVVALIVLVFLPALADTLGKKGGKKT